MGLEKKETEITNDCCSMEGKKIKALFSCTPKQQARLCERDKRFRRFESHNKRVFFSIAFPTCRMEPLELHVTIEILLYEPFNAPPLPFFSFRIRVSVEIMKKKENLQHRDCIVILSFILTTSRAFESSDESNFNMKYFYTNCLSN